MTVMCANLDRWTGVVAVMMTLLTAPVIGSTPTRLTKGNRTHQLYSGRLEVFYNGTWGTVCDDAFNDRTAGVVCRTLGYSLGYFVTNSVFGAGIGQIWLDQVVCSGLETDISECSHNGWGEHNCGHGEDVGLVCVQIPGTPIRLVNGFGYNDSLNGRLEVFYNNTWGTVCDDSFTPNTARAICSLLGFRTGSKAENSRFGAGRGQIWLDEVVCSGEESDLSQCSHNDWGVNNCQHSEDVGRVCLNTPVTPLRLVGGFGDAQSLTGRLEMFFNDTWGTFCQGSFTPNTARVICQFLGFSEGISLGTVIRRGSGPLLFGTVQCTGEETDILQCKLFKTNVCTKYRVASLQCFLPRPSTGISSTTVTTQIPDKTQTPTELSPVSDAPVLCKIQASDSNAESKGLDNRALIVGVAVGVGEAVLGIVIVVIAVVVRRYRHSHGGGHNESGARDEHCYENEVFVDQNRRRNRPCPEVTPETERPHSASSEAERYEQVVFKSNCTTET